MEKVSIIIPVYNTGVFLRKCIKSIINQTYANIEIIIIDDGSEELTAKICDELAANDNRIKVIHKKNEGVSIARNAGLELAKGEFISFVDSDDWIEDEMIASLVKEMKDHDADIVMCDATTIWDSGKQEIDTFNSLPQSCTLNKLDITPLHLLELAGSSCRVLYKSKKLKNHSVTFPTRIKFSEDRIFNMIALGCCTKFRYIKKSFYNRYMRVGSCVMSYHSDYTEITLKVNNIMKEVLLKYWDKSYITFFQERNIRNICNNSIDIFNINRLKYKEKHKAIKNIFSNKELQSLLEAKTSLNIAEYCINSKNLYGIYILSKCRIIKNIAKSIIKR